MSFPAQLVLLAAISALTAQAQEAGGWRADSRTAKTITGDVAFAPDKLYINFIPFSIASIRPLQPAEIAAAFDSDSTAPGAGNLYRLSVPGTKKFLHNNTLCGTDDTQWLATYASGKTLHLAFFSGATMPVFTLEALANATSLCGTYSYVR
jgi:hypothetical protein